MVDLELVFDLLGTFVFALSGAAAGVRRRLDFFGVMVVSFAAANAGGITRDLLIGAVPPAAIADWRHLAASLVAGVLTYFWHPALRRLQSFVLVADAGGLALFAVAGTQKALAAGLDPVMAAVLGMVTGIGGGIMRDVLLRLIPTVLRAEIYGSAALAGAAVVVAGHVAQVPPAVATITGAVLCFAIRMLAIARRWNMPAPPPHHRGRDDSV
jgi:uncharacterized membrane protein YeiH